MSALDKFWIRINAKEATEVNSNGKWPSGRDDLQFYAMLFAVAGATWVYSLQLLAGN